MLSSSSTDNRVHINVTGNLSQLTFDRIQPGDAGRYSVCVENELGTDTVSHSLTVEGEFLRGVNERKWNNSSLN